MLFEMECTYISIKKMLFLKKNQKKKIKEKQVCDSTPIFEDIVQSSSYFPINIRT